MLKENWIRAMDLSRLTLRERVILSITVVVAFVVVTSYLFLPKWKQSQEAGTQIQLAQAEIARLSAQLPELKKKSEELRAVGPKAQATSAISSRIGDLMTGGSRLSSLLEEMTSLARMRHVEFVSIRPEAVEDKGNYLELSLRLDLKSRFREMGDYLLMLENLPRALRIKDVKVETNPSISPDVLTHLQVLTYVGKD